MPALQGAGHARAPSPRGWTDHQPRGDQGCWACGSVSQTPLARDGPRLGSVVHSRVGARGPACHWEASAGNVAGRWRRSSRGGRTLAPEPLRSLKINLRLWPAWQAVFGLRGRQFLACVAGSRRRCGGARAARLVDRHHRPAIVAKLFMIVHRAQRRALLVRHSPSSLRCTTPRPSQLLPALSLSAAHTQSHVQRSTPA